MSKTEPLKLSDRLARYQAKPSPLRRRRLVHKLNKAFGEALTLRGAAKKSKLSGLAKLVDGKLPGYTVPARAQEALDKYEQKVSE